MTSRRVPVNRNTLFWGAAVGILFVVMYPIATAPILDSSDYKKMQNITRANINQESIQPGNMKVWSNPFGKQ